MKNFIIYNSNGDILRTGTCPDDHLSNPTLPGTFIMEGIASDVRHRIENGRIVEKPPVATDQPTYAELRAPEYPPLADLADALYWQSKGDASYLATYFARVEAVKMKYPKPNK